MIEIVCWGMFTKRADGTCPKMCKLLNERVYFDEAEAIDKAAEYEAFLSVEVRKLLIREDRR